MDLLRLREAASEPAAESAAQARAAVATIDVRVPKYRAIAEIGRGGMATVYLALAHGAAGFSKLVVLKCIRPEIATEAEFITMFMDEARLAACLSHPNIVQTNEVIDRAGIPVIVMEYLEGHTLSEILRRGRRTGNPMPLAMHLHILIEVLRGLHYAHEAKDFHGTPLNLVHRDVSPQNILVTYSGEVKILDFGIAKSAEASQETRSGVLKGKIRYMAPEQVVAKGIDRRADVYSVGVLLWQAIAGRDLWQGQSDLEVMQAVLMESIPNLRDVVQDVPSEAEQVLAGAIAFEPGDRYATAAEFGQRMAELVKSLGPKPDTRDLELYMNELFAEEREQTRALIAESIGRAQEASFSGTGEIAFPSQLGTRNLPIISLTDPARVRPAPNATSQRGRMRLWVGAGALLAILAGLGTLYLVRRVRPNIADSVLPSTTSAPQRAPVKVRILATPNDAHLTLDGMPLSKNPFEGALVPDGKQHLLRAELTGYIPREERFVFNGEVMVSLALEHEPQEPPPPVVSGRTSIASVTSSRPHVHRPPAPVLPPPVRAAEPIPDCDPPYYTDPDGIRRVRPGCS